MAISCDVVDMLVMTLRTACHSMADEPNIRVISRADPEQALGESMLCKFVST